MCCPNRFLSVVSMRILCILSSLSIAIAVGTFSTAQEKEGFQDLFNGKDLTGWQDKNGEPSKWKVEDGAMMRKDKKAGDIWTKDRFGDFVLTLEFKTEGNSGVFIRTDNPRNNVQTGIEIQVDKPRSVGRHSVGAIYDLVAPSEDASKAGKWNKMRVRCVGNVIVVKINDKKIASMNLDEWTEANKNPDGSKNKFKTALKDFKREGHIGFQDHGANVAYRNVKIKRIAAGGEKKEE